MLFQFFYKFWYSYSFKKKFKQSYWYLSKLLNESQYWNDNKMREHQDKHLSELHGIITGTLFYPPILKKTGLRNLNTGNVTELDPLSKEVLKKNPGKLLNHRVTEYMLHSTSGSSGDPVKIRTSLNAGAYRLAGRMRYYSWWGIRPSDRNVLIWGKSKHSAGNVSLLERIKRIFIKRIFNISVFDLHPEDFQTLVKRIKLFKPVYFRGYTSGIEQFADLCHAHEINLAALNLKGVIVTSEILFESTRNKISLVFGCPVINEYGAADGGLIAFECPSGSMHIFEEALLINTTSSGNVLLTDLHNHAMPLINYELGDRIKFADGKKCKCGRNLKIIEQIEGRQADYIQKRNGQKLSQYFFYYLMKDLDTEGFQDNILKYKVTQKGKVFDFYYVKGMSYSGEVLSYINSRMISEIGEDTEINFKPVTEIKRETSGKICFFTRE